KRFPFEFNPAQLSISQRSQWKSTPTAAVRKAAKPQFMGAEPREMTLEIFLDSSMKPGGNTVMKKVESLLICCEV
ncbi:peptidase M23, partial [Streptomyces fulvissimus]|nr:peptidase M23 [Streptomyces microflavus]